MRNLVMPTKREVVESRRKILRLAKKKYAFNKGDKRVAAPRVCVICGRPLSSLVINENKYVAIQNHTRYYLNEMFIVDICTNVSSCYRTLLKKGLLQ